MASQRSNISYTVPGVSAQDSGQIIALLQMRLHSLNDLSLTLKHVHWNVVGPHFIAVHEMIDPQVDQVRSMADDLAERISTLGGEPNGTPGALVKDRTWNNYSIGRAEAIEHLGALDMVYTSVIKDHREAMQATETSDPVTQDMLIEQLRGLELFQWFVRAHLESSGGVLSTRGASTETGAAGQAAEQARTQP
ncbi:MULTISPECIES: DNA starvation/stationary phase protection protein [unclassified Streptomyces]|uniref:DNA starvation/stationary phase protection protein n=2 Tax=Streptomyces TaxID=1883 RepID=A0ABU2RMK2_9ACTN|nr:MULTISPECIES: DNA starvation/stationary phase protection protein [unclassified Streptomyces]MYR66041.1 DNA starvation/stationary phase protection protein [Streptomyces sp. SID4939]MYS03335.1 DNA starvation/stationary phase protection protein [Streptomyces sp. SID4940]MYT65834.1 DNA starvation/stationary phase protection protein [Streptomyces sp. SID8357]MYT84130.1 DNA starvation/stationary phase protection protein [Streptomyces sp. SID8360]MYU36224.1 DNA starvation/stationary phase protecti